MSTGGSGDVLPLGPDAETIQLAEVLLKESHRGQPRSVSPASHPPRSPATTPHKRDSVSSAHGSERNLDALHVRRARRSSVTHMDHALMEDDAVLRKRCDEPALSARVDVKALARA